jgi:membrane-bound serine protease (ClpP class)
MFKNFGIYVLIFFLVSYCALAEKVLVGKIDSDINPSTARYISLLIAKAKAIKADALVIEINTFGGTVADADKIRQDILAYKSPSYAFINKNAASAGALISIACEKIYMSPGSSIGAATVVEGGGNKASEKYQSYMRGVIRSTAEARGRDPEIAQQMVGITNPKDSSQQQVLTLTFVEAMKFGFADGQMNNIESILEVNKLKNAKIEYFDLPFIERIIGFFMRPAISGILILLIIGGLYYELQSPGIGFPLAVSVIAGVLYLTPYYLNGLAENWELILLLAGIGLLLVEILVIPGFGIAGIAGLVCIFGALFLIMLPNQWFNFDPVDNNAFMGSLTAVAIGLFGTLILIVALGYYMPETRFFKRVELSTSMQATDGFSSATYTWQSLIGKTGIAHTNLRPIGKVEIEGELYDASTHNDWIAKDTKVRVNGLEGNTLKVKPITES